MDAITVKILKHNKYKGRKDVENPSWFKLSNRILEDEDFFSFSHEEMLIWIEILALASIQKTDQPTINFERLNRFCRLSAQAAMSAIDKLEALGIVSRVTPTSRRRNVRVTSTGPREEKKREEENREDMSREEKSGTGAQDGADDSQKLSPRLLVEIWNSDRGTFPEVLEFSDERKKKAAAQLKKYPDIAHWRGALAKFKASRFCREEWKPSFDDWLSESKRVKALEGKYDDRAGKAKAGGKAPPAGALQREINADQEMQQLMSEVFNDAV